MRNGAMIVIGGLIATGVLSPVAAQVAGNGAGPGTAPAPRAQGQSRGIRILSAGEGGSAGPAASPTPAPMATPEPVAVATPIQVAVSVPAKPCARPLGVTDLRLGNDGEAGAQLARKLRGGRRVTIDLTTPYPVRSDTPAPLAAWFSAVKASGGAVEVKPYCDQGSRNLFTRLFGISSPKDPDKAYRAARAYNVVVYNDARARTVTQVEFVPRDARTAQGR